ncbi:MAG: M23 family metallopeptidase [Hormoscilla sp. SP12CHS1]|nr:M23 family metallopeptidase [Hormoscilla sp. SP12CHS1]
MQANQLADVDLIKVNQLLTIPPKRPTTSIGFASAESSTFNNAPETVKYSRYTRGLLLEQKAMHLRMLQEQATSGDNLREKKPEAVAAASIRNDQSVSQSSDGDLSEETAPYIWPAEGTLTSRYGWRWGRLHKGIDIAGPIGTRILSVAPGEVKFAGWNRGGYGYLVEIRHDDGNLTRYAHNSHILVRKGQQVNQGQQIAEMGSTGYSTGPHLHFEFHLPGKGAHDPISYLPPRK